MLTAVKSNCISILLVEDDLDYATLIQQTLLKSRRASLQVTCVGSIAAALTLLACHKFDILLVDLGLPDGRGLDVVDKVKEAAGQTPFIVLTGLEDEEIGFQSVRRGAQDYLVKRRVNAEALIRCVQYVVERTRMERRRSALYAVTALLSESRHLREAMQRIIQVICQTAAFDLGELFVLSKDRDVMHFGEGWHKPSIAGQEFLCAGRNLEIKVGDDVPGRVWATDCPVWLPALGEENGLLRKKEAAQAQLHTVCAFPISFHKEVLAVLCFYSQEVYARDAELLEMLCAIGSQIGQFIERESAEESAREILMMRLREDFMATLAHDLKIPLIGADRLLEVLLSGKIGELKAEHADLLEQLKSSNESMLKMVQNLVDVYRYESGGNILDLQAVDLKELVLGCVSEMKALSEEKGVQLTALVPCQIGKSLLDGPAIRRVLSVILGNALKFTPQGGAVEVLLEREQGRFLIQVKDTGPGIPPDEERYLFQRFWRGGQKNKAIGTGLGLHLSRQIVEAHNGSICCESQPGDGTTFRIYLPATQAAGNPDDTYTNIICDRKRYQAYKTGQAPAS